MTEDALDHIYREGNLDFFRSWMSISLPEIKMIYQFLLDKLFIKESPN